MKKSSIYSLVLGLVAAGSLQSASAQIIVSDDFNYANLAALQANWGATAGLGLDTVGGFPTPSASHDGSATIHNWVGSVFSITPTALNPIRLTVDIYDTGIGNQRNTVGLRGGPFPLLELGMYNNFNDPAPGSGEGVRVVTFAGNENWHQMGPFTTGWSRWEATITDLSLTVRVDTGIDGSWDLTWTSTGLTPSGAFTDLRFGGPSGNSSAASGFVIDNLVLEVIAVPEPSTIALGAMGGAAFLVGVLRRRRA